MPFGRKADGQGGTVFDSVYADRIAPAVTEAGLEPLRAGQHLVGGLIHKPMYERLILSDFASRTSPQRTRTSTRSVCSNALRPYSTVLIGADVQRTPFDLAPDRILP